VCSNTWFSSGGCGAVFDARLAREEDRRSEDVLTRRSVMERPAARPSSSFWVARMMMMMGLHFMKEVPFKTGLPSRDGARRGTARKMSKTKGAT